ncbi:malonate transporter, MadL subunit [Brevibacterium sp. 239c]|uniref:malonate transporter subunit MadL n=1 Tax=Brevibacterium sp. 239c TaxID=1965356 RepID=UPI000C5DE2BA|nr:malonate transporter subunit MadL [Brevibacterium sp. 239c]SMY04240.1 malonate transporter, MadL subunit [Brevibacterium sp. 239c]
MIILGVALLSGSLLIGTWIGTLLGDLLGVDANVGGVGIAMLLLILSTNFLVRNGRLKPETSSGISFWSGMYIPIVVAMAATQNVVGAVTAGPVALVAGIAAVIASFALVPVLARVKTPGIDEPVEEFAEVK